MKIKEILSESIYISRWNDDKTALTAVLTPDETEKIINDIISNLNKEGYKIVKK